MNPEKLERLDALVKQLAETLMTAVLCTREIGDVVRAELDSDLAAGPFASRHEHRWLAAITSSGR